MTRIAYCLADCSSYPLEAQDGWYRSLDNGQRQDGNAILIGEIGQTGVDSRGEYEVPVVRARTPFVVENVLVAFEGSTQRGFDG